LTTKKRDNVAMYIKDLARVLQTNLTTTKQRYTHGRHRIETSLFCQLAIFSGNRPSALLSLCYSDIAVTLLRGPSNGPHRILIEFTCEFTKKYLGTEESDKENILKYSRQSLLHLTLLFSLMPTLFPIHSLLSPFSKSAAMKSTQSSIIE
jgi:hypothetical protein